MQYSRADVWGMTMHPKFEWNGEMRNEHIQSYFLLIRKDVLTSEIFYQYWKKLRYPKSKEDAIIDFELKFSRLMCENGFLIDAMYDSTVLDKAGEELEKKFDMPIIKRNKL